MAFIICLAFFLLSLIACWCSVNLAIRFEMDSDYWILTWAAFLVCLGWLYACFITF